MLRLFAFILAPTVSYNHDPFGPWGRTRRSCAKLRLTSTGFLIKSQQTTCLRSQVPMNIKLLVDFAEFWQSLELDIATASQRVLVQTFSFEGDSVGALLADALEASPARDRRVLVDSFSKIVLNDRFLYRPANFFDSQLRREAIATRQLCARLDAAGIQVKYGNPFSF